MSRKFFSLLLLGVLSVGAAGFTGNVSGQAPCDNCVPPCDSCCDGCPPPSDCCEEADYDDDCDD